MNGLQGGFHNVTFFEVLTFFGSAFSEDDLLL